MAMLRFEAGDNTEELLQYVLDGLDQDLIDQMSVDRDLEEMSGLASEPITTAVTITVATTSILAITRLIERWLEHKRQLDTLRIVADGFRQSDEVGKSLASLAAKHSAVSISYGLMKEPGKAGKH